MKIGSGAWDKIGEQEVRDTVGVLYLMVKGWYVLLVHVMVLGGVARTWRIMSRGDDGGRVAGSLWMFVDSVEV
jgi:hypothetical protein